MFFWVLAKIEVALLFGRTRSSGCCCGVRARSGWVRSDRVVFIVVARQRRRVVAEPEYVGAVVVSGGRDDARGGADQRGGNDFGHTGSAQGRIDGQAVRRFARLLLRLPDNLIAIAIISVLAGQSQVQN